MEREAKRITLTSMVLIRIIVIIIFYCCMVSHTDESLYQTEVLSYEDWALAIVCTGDEYLCVTCVDCAATVCFVWSNTQGLTILNNDDFMYYKRFLDNWHGETFTTPCGFEIPSWMTGHR